MPYVMGHTSGLTPAWFMSNHENSNCSLQFAMNTNVKVYVCVVSCRLIHFVNVPTNTHSKYTDMCKECLIIQQFENTQKLGAHCRIKPICSLIFLCLPGEQNPKHVHHIYLLTALPWNRLP